MNILDTIKADYKTARFNNDGVSKSLLSTLIGDIQNTEKRLLFVNLMQKITSKSFKFNQ
jgi:hypothetical protein